MTIFLEKNKLNTNIVYYFHSFVNINVKKYKNNYDIQIAGAKFLVKQNRNIDALNRLENIIKKFENYPIRGVLADIGVSSLQLDKLDRGFSFNSENLDMRMNQNQSLDASTIINSYSQLELENIFKEYGEIREYKKIASLIVQNRPFYSAKELAEFFYNKLPKGKIHPATLIFQAIRIEVNDELGVLDRLFKSMEEAKLKDCIVAIISFHSLEDRVVKNYFKKWSENCICPKDAFRCECGKNHALGKIITKKPIIATNIEIKQNPRSRSAKLRVFRFV